MSVDIVSLVYAADATKLTEAEKAFDRLTAAAARNDAAERKRLTATERAGVTTRQTTDAMDRATRSATDHARAQGAVERATISAARASADVRAQRALEAASMRELVAATKAYERDQIAAGKAAAAAAREQAQAVSVLEGRIAALKASIDPTYAAQARLDAEMREASALYKMGAISSSDYAQAVAVLDQRMAAAARGHNTLIGVQGRAVGSTKAMTMAGLGLSRQLADVGVTAAMGMNPLMILIQQGPQIAGVFQEAKIAGLGFRAVLAGITAQLAPILAVLSPLLIVVGAAAAAFALFNRELNKGASSKELIASLHLTEEQLKRIKDETITFGDTMKATFNVLGRYIMDSPIGDAIDALRKNINAWLDDFATNSVKEVAVVVGAFVGAYEAIKAVWNNFPAVMADIGARTANLFIDHIEKMVNRAISALNQFMSAAKVAAGLGIFGPGAQALAGIIKPIGAVSLERVQSSAPGAAGDVAAAARAGFERGRSGTMDAASGFLGDVRAERSKLFLDRVREKAGDANKTPKGAAAPRDVTDERLAQLAKQLAQAKQEELQASLALATDAHVRADLQRQILKAETDEKVAAYDGEIAKIRNDKNNTQKKALIEAYESLKKQEEVTAGLKAQAIAIEETTKAYQDRIAESSGAAKAQDDLDDARAQAAIDIGKAQASILRSAYAQDVANVDILKAEQALAETQLERQILGAAARGLSANEIEILKLQLEALKASHAAQVEIAERSTTMANALRDATTNVRNFKDAFKRYDMEGVIGALVATIQTIRQSFAQNGMLGGIATVGTVAGSLIGGKTGRIVSGAAGYLGAGVGLGAFAGTTAGAAALGTLGLGAGSIGAIASLAGPIGAVVAGLYVLSQVFKGKPSNAGAGYDLITGATSGKSATAETTAAVKQAGDAITQMQDLLKQSGITLGATINGLVIGSRDQSQIYTSTGKTIFSAVGDPAAAAEAAFKAMLDGAKYVDDTQKKLVESMVAAGKGFDDVAAALQGYAQAQQMLTAVNDEILRLTDPKAYDLQAVKRANEEQVKAARAAYDAGYLTATQLDELNAALGRLNGLQVDEVLKRYGADNDNFIDGLRSSLQDAYEKDAAALEDQASAYRQFADSLRSYSDQIRGVLAGTFTPGQQLGIASRRFQNIASLAAQGDKGALGQFQGSAEAFRQASAQYAPDAKTNQRNLAAIQRATQDALAASEAQVGAAEASLAVLQSQVAPYLNDIRANTLSTVQALNALGAALAAKASGGNPVEAAVAALASLGPTAAASDPFSAAAYLAANKDIVKYAAANGLDPEAFARQHYMSTGQFEVAAGARVRGYASGTNSASAGWHWVGEQGPELMRFRGGEQVIPNHRLGGSNDNGALVAAIDRLNARLAKIEENTRTTAKESRTTATVLQGAQNGVPIQTQAA